jgi:hypothetical protein
MAYRQWTPDEAVEQLQSKGYDADAAQTMVRTYLDAGTARHGEPDGGWRIDEYDLAEIERKATEQSPENLAAAVRAVVADYRDELGDPDVILADAIASTRRDLDLDDIDGLANPEHGEPVMDEATAAAYRAVLNADAGALDAAMRGAAPDDDTDGPLAPEVACAIAAADAASVAGRDQSGDEHQATPQSEHTAESTSHAAADS